MIQLMNISSNLKDMLFLERKKKVQLYDSYTEYYLPMNMLTQFYWQGTDLTRKGSTIINN